MGHLCRRHVKLVFLTKKIQKMYFWLLWMKDNNSQNALASLP